MNAFFLDRHDFVPYGVEHGLILVLYSLIGLGIIYYCRQQPEREKYRKHLSYFLAFITILQLVKPFIRLHFGIFDIKNDLPLHLCNMLPLFMWLSIRFNSRLWFSILFFWVIIGTTQSLFTPTVTETFPHYESIRYWTVHFRLTFAALFGWLVIGFIPTPRHALLSLLVFNILALSIYFINVSLDSNYWYLNGKPKEATLLDSLWHWPNYIIQLEIISLSSFLGLAYLIKWVSPVDKNTLA